jgi:2-phospho-L-lactate guanylyltransferase
LMQPLILIPCKSFAAGKSRLSAVLSPERRDRLCRSFLVNTVNLAADLVAKGQIHVVSSDREVTAVASELGVRCEGEADFDLNSALTRAVARISEREPETLLRDILILPIDLVRSTPAAIATVIAAQADAVLVPDRPERGTNLLRLRGDAATKFRFRYGEDSFARHGIEAEGLGLTVVVFRNPLLCFDVDTPDDYVAWTNDATEPSRPSNLVGMEERTLASLNQPKTDRT